MVLTQVLAIERSLQPLESCLHVLDLDLQKSVGISPQALSHFRYHYALRSPGDQVREALPLDGSRDPLVGPGQGDDNEG